MDRKQGLYRLQVAVAGAEEPTPDSAAAGAGGLQSPPLYFPLFLNFLWDFFPSYFPIFSSSSTFPLLFRSK